MRNNFPQFGAAANQVDRKWTFPSGVKITLSGIFGLYLSYFADINSGASIVLVSTLFFIVVYLRKKFFQRKNQTGIKRLSEK
jgi:ABC-type Mn2+/Zn2+ transport system permease subunit